MGRAYIFLLIMLVLVVPLYAGESWQTPLFEDSTGAILDIAYYDGYIYAVGYYYRLNENSTHVFIAKLALNGEVKWTKLLDVSDNNDNPRLGILNGKIYVVFNVFNENLSYDVYIARVSPEDGSFTIINPNITNLRISDIAIAGDKIFVFGTRKISLLGGKAVLYAIDPNGTVVKTVEYSVLYSYTWARKMAVSDKYLVLGFLVTDRSGKPEHLKTYIYNASDFSEIEIDSLTTSMDCSETGIMYALDGDYLYILAASELEDKNENLYYLGKIKIKRGSSEEVWGKETIRPKDFRYSDIYFYDNAIYIIATNKTKYGDAVTFVAYDSAGNLLWEDNIGALNHQTKGYVLTIHENTIYYGGAILKEYLSPLVGAYPISQGFSSYLIGVGIAVAGVVGYIVYTKFIKKEEGNSS